MTTVINDWAKILDNRGQVDKFILDFEKAFDTRPHELLISSDIESEIRLFADDGVCYREIKDEKDTMKLQRDIDRLGSWAESGV